MYLTVEKDLATPGTVPYLQAELIEEIIAEIFQAGLNVPVQVLPRHPLKYGPFRRGVQLEVEGGVALVPVDGDVEHQQGQNKEMILYISIQNYYYSIKPLH